MNRRVLLVSVGLLLAFVFGACGGSAAEPTAIPPTSTRTPAPITPTPSISVITVAPQEDFEGFLAQMPAADADCLISSLGESRLAELAGGADSTAREQSVLAGCFSNELVVGFIAGQIQQASGSFSGSSMACLESLLVDVPTGALSELMIGDGEPQSEVVQLTMEGFIACMTQEEVMVLSGLNDDDSAGSGGDGVSYVSRDEACMAGELGESFAAGYGATLNGAQVQSFANAMTSCGVGFSTYGLIIALEDTERAYSIADLEAAGFKKSKTYDIADLDGVSSVHYGFYGLDPYDRLEYEARFYFSHEAASEIGVEYADEATGADASLYADDQRWQEGLSDRRRCDSSGGHHVGRCGYPKYFDYVVVGNMVLLCQGKDTLESIQGCAELLAVVR